jgi:hypothetical protein
LFHNVFAEGRFARLREDLLDGAGEPDLVLVNQIWFW